MYFSPKRFLGELKSVYTSEAWPALGTTLTMKESFQLAMSEAMRGAGYVAPNPLVGCVILDAQGKFLSKGYHVQFGSDHAEVAALIKVTDRKKLKNAKVFVTLEPCSHFGKTPPCAKALIKAGVGEVYYGVADPNPQVNGKGAALLRAAGINVQCAQKIPELSLELKQDLKNLCEVFLVNQTQKRAFFSLKLASSLDGNIALASGESKWITGPLARSLGHLLRAYYGAIMVGGRTLENDNPALNVRHTRFPGYENKVLIWDPSGRRLKDSWKIFKTHKSEDIYWIVGKGVSVRDNIIPRENILTLSSVGEDLNADELPKKLFEIGIQSVLVEGGGHLASVLFKQNAIDRGHIFMAPKILGSGISWSDNLYLKSMAQADAVHDLRRRFLGPDTLFSFRIF